ncbi:MAG: CHAT domain-containing protein [Leptolyngbyaceae cyanobacterium SL_7_1]|nr:CHAT domain-containing protein [Leptolyngbyaceae cyanobacterium SL_7_1]
MVSRWQRLGLFVVGMVLAIAPILPWSIGSATASVAAPPSVQQGRIFYQQQQFDQAIQQWQQAEQQFEQSGDSLQQALVLTYLSLAWQQQGQWAEAEATIEQSFVLLDGLENWQEERSPILAQALNSRGKLELALGDPEAALATWQRATTLYTQLQDPVGVTGSLINQAQAMEAIGWSRRACLTLLDALALGEGCDRADLANLESRMSQLATQPDVQVRILGLRNLGNGLRLVGYLPESERVLSEGLELAQTARLPLEESAMRLSLGNTARDRYEQAQELYERTGADADATAVRAIVAQALEHYRQASEVLADRPAIVAVHYQAHVQQLRVLTDFQAWLRAIGSSPEATALQPSIQHQIALLLGRSGEAVPTGGALATQIQLAEQLIQVSRAGEQTYFVEVQHLLQTALHQAEARGDDRSRSLVLGTLGYLYEQQGTPETAHLARQQTQQALILAQSHLAWELAYRWQWQLARLYAAAGAETQAIAYYQIAIETLETVRQNVLALDTEVQLSFREQVEPVYRELASLLLDNPNQPNLNLAVRTIERLQVSQLENFLRCHLSPRVVLGEEPVDTKAAVVYSILLPDRLAVILNPVQSDQLYGYVHWVERDRVNATVSQLRQELELSYVSPEGVSLSQQVYDWLIRPFREVLQANSVETLVFVLDEGLRTIPMAALHDGEYYLLADYAVALTPGLQLFAAAPLAAVQRNALGFGLSEIRPDFPPHAAFTPLVNVPLELAQIEAQIAARTRLNQEFTSTSLQQTIATSTAPIVHLATHGQFSSALEQTFILTWDQRVDIDQLSGLLRRRDQTTAAPIELLVLSACETAAGDRRAALGLAGMAVRSGARSTVASLWTVNDQATAALMEQFYQALTQPANQTRANALRQAQLKLLETPGYRAPFIGRHSC